MVEAKEESAFVLTDRFDWSFRIKLHNNGNREKIIDITQQLPYNRSKKNDEGEGDVFLGSAQDNYKLL